MKRRNFMAAILAAGMAPAVVRAASLMPVRMRGLIALPAYDDIPLSAKAAADMFPHECFVDNLLCHHGSATWVVRRDVVYAVNLAGWEVPPWP